MTAETLHDALTLLPADLIAQADRKRNRKPVRVHWQRWAAMAACLGVILGFGLLLRSRLLYGGAKSASAEMSLQAAADNCAPEDAAAEVPAAGTTAAAPQSAPPLQDSAAATMGSGQGIRYVNTPDNLYTTGCRVHGPEVTLITSREALDAYLDNWDLDYYLDELRVTCEDYDNAWFKAHDLVLIPVYPVTTDDSVTVTEVIETGEGLEIHIAVSQSEEDAEYTTWHILLEIEKGQIASADDVTLVCE